MKAEVRNILSWSLKISISIAVVWYLTHKLIEAGYQLQDISKISIVPAIISLVLVPLNLGLGAQKWRIMVRNFYPKLSFEQSFGAILAGMTTGIFTPNRIGEYGGRVFMLPPGKRLEAVIITFIDRVCQMMVTVWAGSIALIGFIYFILDLSPGLKYSLIVSVLFINGLLILLAFSRKFIIRIFDRFRHYKYLRVAQMTLERLSPGVFGKVISLAILRYFVFTFQFVLLLYAFGYDKGILLAIWMILLIYLLKSFAPSIALSELGVRETIAVYVMEQFHVADPGISFNSTFLLYLFNIALPSVFGMVFLPRLKFFGKKSEK
jgi:hypothetical protein